MSKDTRTRLLKAAENILIREGAHALTVRRVGEVSSLNPTLVTYHCGTVAGLLGELCRLNLEPMMAGWSALWGEQASRSGLRDTVRIWLGPLLQPAAFTFGGRALVVLDQIAAHGDPELSRQLLEAMVTVSGRVHAALRPLTPHLDPRELRARLRFLAGAALGAPPRVRAAEKRKSSGEQKLDSLRYLCAFAEAALSPPARDRA
jgi:AcrR family transcriptional regulator